MGGGRFERAVEALVDRLVDRATGHSRALSDDEIDAATRDAAAATGVEIEQLSYALQIEGDLRRHFRAILGDATLAPLAGRVVESAGARAEAPAPTDVRVYYHNGINALIGDDDPELASRAMRHVLDLSPTDPALVAGAHYHLGLCLAAQDDPKGARAALTTALALARDLANPAAIAAAEDALARLDDE